MVIPIERATSRWVMPSFARRCRSLSPRNPPNFLSIHYPRCVVIWRAQTGHSLSRSQDVVIIEVCQSRGKSLIPCPRAVLLYHNSAFLHSQALSARGEQTCCQQLVIETPVRFLFFRFRLKMGIFSWIYCPAC